MLLLLNSAAVVTNQKSSLKYSQSLLCASEGDPEVFLHLWKSSVHSSHSPPADLMMKPLSRFIAASRVCYNVESLPHSAHLLSALQTWPSSLCGLLVCKHFLPLENKQMGFVELRVVQIDLLAQTICSCFALAKWLHSHWSTDMTRRPVFTSFFVFSRWLYLFILLKKKLNRQ